MAMVAHFKFAGPLAFPVFRERREATILSSRIFSRRRARNCQARDVSKPLNRIGMGVYRAYDVTCSPLVYFVILVIAAGLGAARTVNHVCDPFHRRSQALWLQDRPCARLHLPQMMPYKTY